MHVTRFVSWRESCLDALVTLAGKHYRRTHLPLSLYVNWSRFSSLHLLPRCADKGELLSAYYILLWQSHVGRVQLLLRRH